MTSGILRGSQSPPRAIRGELPNPTIPNTWMDSHMVQARVLRSPVFLEGVYSLARPSGPLPQPSYSATGE